MTEVVENKTSNRSKLRDVWDQFKSHKGALLGGFIFFSIVIIVMIGPFFWPFEANGIDIRSRNQVHTSSVILLDLVIFLNHVKNSKFKI